MRTRPENSELPPKYLGTVFSIGAAYSRRDVAAKNAISLKEMREALQRSQRLSTALPAACSGDMYAAVPKMIRACVAWMEMVGEVSACVLDAPAGSIAFASPKSSTFTVLRAATVWT